MWPDTEHFGTYAPERLEKENRDAWRRYIIARLTRALRPTLAPTPGVPRRFPSGPTIGKG